MGNSTEECLVVKGGFEACKIAQGAIRLSRWQALRLDSHRRMLRNLKRKIKGASGKDNLRSYRKYYSANYRHLVGN